MLNCRSTRFIFSYWIFHDKNLNGIMNVNDPGTPKEGYEFSNHAQGIFGPAKFEDAFFHQTSSYTAKIGMKQ